jgi:putative ABC transport system substrate-binding protein
MIGCGPLFDIEGSGPRIGFLYGGVTDEGSPMRRRDFIALLGGKLAAWPLAASAQESGRTYRLGGLTPSPRDSPHYVALFDELRRLGFVEGHNLTIDWRGYCLPDEQFSAIAVDLIKAKVDVIYCAGNAAIRAAQKATTTVPILAVTDDMVKSGLVHSLAQPGGNTTGMSIFATELDGKRQDMLIEAMPKLRRLGALADVNASTPQHLQALQDAAKSHGAELSIHWIVKSEEIVPAIDAAKTSDAMALNVLSSPLLYANRRIIIDHTAALYLPAVYQWAEIAQEGGFIAYGPRIIHMFRELGRRQLIELFRGVKPADLPVQQPTKVELVINLKTAKTLGLSIPPTLLARADEVIE